MNPFAAPSDLLYGLPPFDRISTADFPPAFEAAMAEQLAEIEAIAGSSEPPTFANTLVALERSGQMLQRVSAVFFSLTSTDLTSELEAIQNDVMPKLAAHHDTIFLDARLFGRIKTLYDARPSLDLSAEDGWLLERYHLDFVRAGAALSPEDQERLRELNQELSTLTTQFSNNLLADTNELSSEVGVDLRLFTDQPALATLEDRARREQIYRASVSRGLRANAYDNRDLVLKIASLRARHAALLGYPDHAAYAIDDTTAKTVTAVSSLLSDLVPPAIANARAEADELRTLPDDGTELEPWDWAFYAAQVRRTKYAVDEEALKPYFDMDRVLVDGVFYAASQLYGLRFDERHDLPTYNPEVRVFEVFDEDGSAVGLFLADLYTRDSKRGGAWMSSFVKQSGLLGTSPVVLVNLNVDRPADGEPTLLTFDEVNTLFHEFGHALHGLFSAVEYPRFAATSVPRDFVEYPSQVNEMWALWPSVLANYARHYKTGDPLPAEQVARLKEAAQYGEGYRTTEYLKATLLDQAWHRLDSTAAAAIDDVEAFEAAALSEAGFSTVPPRYRTTYFMHAFAHDYSARYYSYIWSEVLDADSVRWFEENGGLLRANGDHFRSTVLSKGGSVESMEAFRAFRGADPSIEPLLERRGLTRRD